MKEKLLPKIKRISQIVLMLHDDELTRHNSVGYVTGMDRSKEWSDSLTAHIYKGKYSELEKGMCKRSMDKNGGFSIFRNNIGRKGICKTCLKNTLKDLI